MKKKNYTIVLIVTLLILISAFTACKLQVCSLQYLCGEGGRLKGNAEQSIFSGGNGSEVTAVAAEGYEFTGWSDGVKTASRQDKNVTADITVTAQFTKIQVPEPPHTCESVCPICNKCLNKDCTEEACKEKCTCPAVPAHECQHVCEVCGGCKDHLCTNEACANKCDCPVIPPHTCESVCPTCGKCLNKECTDEACKDKCLGHTPPHVCESVCETCHKCKNETCQEEACKEKCTCHAVPAHECQHVCEVCGKCTNKDCTEQACLEKCDCPVIPPHTCESVCPICNKCLNKDCTEEACKDKCTGHTPPHTCESVCETCHKCKNADCQEEACKEKCTCPAVPAHECQHVCEVCGGCKDHLCANEACANKCSCPMPPHDECASKCPTCGGCKNIYCMESCCQSKCFCVPSAHECSTKCPECGLCTDAECTDENCLPKCQGNHSQQPPQPPKKTYTVTYDLGEGGKIGGQSVFVQTVEEGQNAKIVMLQVLPGYQFWYWSDKPNEQGAAYTQHQVRNVRNDVTVTAVYRPCSYVYYAAFNGSNLVYKGEEGKRFEVFMNEDGTFDEITLVIQPGYRFVGWSDGVTTLTRKETEAIVGFKNVSATVEKVQTIRYSVYHNFGGTILGNCEQVVKYMEDCQPVTAVANEGYVFVGWSDRLLNSERCETQVQWDREHIAFFELEQKTFIYNYNGANQPLQTSVTIQRNGDLRNVQFAVPEKAGYEFCGWYLDEDYETKIADETGRYYLGLLPFSMEETQIYAKWQDPNQTYELPHIKFLMVINSKLIGDLIIPETSESRRVDYTLYVTERHILHAVSKQFEKVFNNWLAGIAELEVDMYYTNDVCTMQSYDPEKDNPWFTYRLFPDDVQEIVDLRPKYRFANVFWALGDFDSVFPLVNSAGMYDTQINLDGMLKVDFAKQLSFYETSSIEQFMRASADSICLLELTIHEFCHLVEFGQGLNDDDFHKLLGVKSELNAMEKSRLFLLDRVEEFGVGGISVAYWNRFRK